jgi:uncharacterized tellurite resistance protein B-like protein
MFEKIKNLLTGSTQYENESMSNNNLMRVRIATAVILLEVAHADEDYSPKEDAGIVEILKKSFNLDNEEVGELLEVSEEERKGSIDIWHFTNIINKHFNDEEKYRVVENIWQIIYADGRLDKYEDHIVHKLSSLLHVPHERLIEAKLKYIRGN